MCDLSAQNTSWGLKLSPFYRWGKVSPVHVQVHHGVKFEPRSQPDSKDCVLAMTPSHLPGRESSVCLQMSREHPDLKLIGQADTKRLLCARPWWAMGSQKGIKASLALWSPDGAGKQIDVCI